ncbi:MAG TPA: hypothetical protein VHG33_06305 [Woeseiaceae bacterium]|nr:hypothetical protein [Woeseiaceae bacterium]
MTTKLSEALDLTGTWRVAHRVTASQRPDFLGLDVEFRITFVQDGGQLAGEGEKFLVDREPADPREVSHLEITGWVHETDVQISLMERSPLSPERTIVGAISWKPVDANRMIGSFRVNLAETSGLSEAVRQTG